MKLSEVYSGISTDRKRWQYYSNGASNIFSMITSKKEKEPWEFISRYFACGGKQSLLSNIKLSANRSRHILSTYLLGIALHEKFYSNCSEDFYIDANDKAKYGKNPWLYTWFLTCLFHDVGYVYEEGGSPFRMSNEYKKLCNDELGFPLALKYYEYRRKHGVADHGIVGGMILYSKLQKLFKEVLKSGGSAVQNNLYYGTAIYNLHKIAARAIMRHNMWTADKEHEEEHREAGLESLIKGGEHSILSAKNGFPFLLGLCDSIEPIKRFGCVETQFLLDNMEICIGNGRLSLELPEVLNTTRYFKMAESLKDWLDVEIKVSCDSKFGGSIDISLVRRNVDLPDFNDLFCD